ncbi:MAG: hypothetical protein ACOVQT_05385 [Rubrivivax sp.]
MPQPLAPVVHGPLVPLSGKVKVSGALQGATVEIVVAGGAVGSALATRHGDVWVPLGRPLVAGEQVVAVQTLGGLTSTPSSVPVAVVAVPSPLPRPVFLSPMSEFMSHVLLGALVPGARVEVRAGAVLAGSAVPEATTAWVQVNPAALNAGAVLTAVQTVNGQPGPAASSMPLVTVDARVVPAPRIDLPLRACDTALHVLECIPAADLVCENAGSSTTWTTLAAQFWATGAPEFRPGPMKVLQRLPGAGTQSPEVILDVEPAVPPGAPVLQPFCPESRRISIAGLKPGAVLTLWKKVAGQADETEIGAMGVGHSTEQVDLPETVGGQGPVMSLVARQSTCGLSSPPGQANEFARPGPGLVPAQPPRVIGPLYDCARAVPCESLATVPARLVSARTGAPLSDWTVPAAPNTLLWTWFGLQAGDVVRVEQIGCGAPPYSNDVRVEPLPVPLPAPVILGEVHPGATAVPVKGLLPGARAHLLVHGVVRASLDAWRDDGVFHLAMGLQDRAPLWVVQTLCAAASAMEGVPVVVKRGTLIVDAVPSKVNRGATVTIVVTARAASDGRVLNGLPVQLGGVTVGLTGTPFTWTAPAAGTTAAGLVRGGNSHHDAPFTLAITQPVQMALGLYPGPGAAPGLVALKDIAWTVSPAWPGGVAKTLASATGTVAVDGAVPGGLVHVSVELKVDLAEDQLYQFPAETVPLPSVHLVSLAMTQSAHAVSALVTVEVITAADDEGVVRYRRWVRPQLLSWA